MRDPSLPKVPRDYQLEGIKKIVAWLKKPRASRRGYISWATGLGKTMEFALLVRACAGLRVLVIESSKQLVEQTIKQLFDFTSATMAHASSQSKITTPDGAQVLHWRNGDGAHEIIVTTDESFKMGYGRFRKEFNPDVIVWDECHWGYSELAQQALDAFPEALVIAFSATPDYLTTTCKADYIPVTLDNGQTLYCPEGRTARSHFGDLIDERTIRWGIQEGHLAPLAWGRVEFKFSLDDVPVVEGPGGMDYEQAALSRHLAKNWPDVVATVRKLYQGKQYGLQKRFSAAICPGIAQAEELAEEIRSLGLKAESLTAKTKDEDRKRILRAGDAGELALVTSVFALREGWDSPRLEVGMMLRPTKSRVLYVQFMGRALRTNSLMPDKVALILDPHYQNTRFAPLSAPALFGTPGQEVIDGGILIRGRKASGGRTKTLKASPYAFANAKPVLVVEKIDVEYWAGPDGTFFAEGERWGTIKAWSRILGRDRKVLKKLLRGNGTLRTRIAIDPMGHPATFYAEAEVYAAYGSRPPRGLPPGADGTFLENGEVVGALEAFQRRLDIKSHNLKKRLNGQGIVGSKRGSRTIYRLSDIERACSDLLVGKADESGVLIVNGEKCTYAKNWARILDLTPSTILGRIRRKTVKGIPGRDPGGRAQEFYAESTIRNLCSDLL